MYSIIFGLIIFCFIILLFCLISFHKKVYKGLILFDIDGTLTTGKENYNIVQYCIDKGWAVGICTANPGYRMDNLLYFDWMPKNLYNFIADNDNITFNNVGSKILMGEYNPDIYLNNVNLNLNIYEQYGYFKGISLEKTGEMLNIINPSKLILCDDDSSYIRGFNSYNNDLVIICAGNNCGGELTLEKIKEYI